MSSYAIGAVHRDFQAGSVVTDIVLNEPCKSQKSVMINLQSVHARMLWNRGWCSEQFDSFEQYLRSIPPVPQIDIQMSKYFSGLVLVDTRVQIGKACRLLGIDFQGSDVVFSSYGEMMRAPSVYWLWAQTGLNNRGRSGFEIRQRLFSHERGLTAFEGVCLFAMHSSVLKRHAIDLIDSHIGGLPAYNACLMVYKGKPTLGVAEYCVGSAVRGAATCVR
jgi:hypothetical protein